MNIKLLITIINLVITPFNINNLKNNVIINVKNNFNELLESIPYWENSNYYNCYTFNFKNSSYKIYEVTKNNTFKGFFIANENNKLETIYIGNDRPNDYSDLSSLSPLFSDSGTTCENSCEVMETSSSNYSFHSNPELNCNLFQSYYNSNYSENIVTGCPTYFNPNDYFCAPTAGAMLMFFYDRYSDLTNLVNGLLPLEQDENNDAVNQLINELASTMNTTENGTIWQWQQYGLNLFLANKGYQYQTFKLTNYLSYTTFNSSCKQPTLLNIAFNNDDDTEVIQHAVLGIGVASIRNQGDFIVSHYGERNYKLGNYYIPSDYFVNAFYVGV